MMNILKKWINFWNDRIKQFTIWDIKYAQIWTAAWILLIVKIFPQMVALNIGWYVAFIMLLAPYLIYIVFIRKNGQEASAND